MCVVLAKKKRKNINTKSIQIKITSILSTNLLLVFHILSLSGSLLFCQKAYWQTPLGQSQWLQGGLLCRSKMQGYKKYILKLTQNLTVNIWVKEVEKFT